MSSDNYIVKLGTHSFTTNISLPVSENNKDAYLQSIVERQRMEKIALNQYHPKYTGMNNSKVGDKFWINLNLSSLFFGLRDKYNLLKEHAYMLLKFRQIQLEVFDIGKDKYFSLKLFQQDINTKKWIQNGVGMWHNGVLTIDSMVLDFMFIDNKNASVPVSLGIKGSLNLNIINNLYEGRLLANEKNNTRSIWSDIGGFFESLGDGIDNANEPSASSEERCHDASGSTAAGCTIGGILGDLASA